MKILRKFSAYLKKYDEIFLKLKIKKKSRRFLLKIAQRSQKDFPKKLYEDLLKKLNVDLLKIFRRFLEEKILVKNFIKSFLSKIF